MKLFIVGSGYPSVSSSPTQDVASETSAGVGQVRGREFVPKEALPVASGAESVSTASAREAPLECPAAEDSAMPSVEVVVQADKTPRWKLRRTRRSEAKKAKATSRASSFALGRHTGTELVGSGCPSVSSSPTKGVASETSAGVGQVVMISFGDFDPFPVVVSG